MKITSEIEGDNSQIQMLEFNQLIKVTRVYVFPTGLLLDNSNYNNSFLVSCMQSDKLCISKSLVRHLENLTLHLGPATCVAILTLIFTSY